VVRMGVSNWESQDRWQGYSLEEAKTLVHYNEFLSKADSCNTSYT
jgi:hypothetical protein